ncbi:MAG: amidohydrolase family protein [Gracilimonas sp.]|uniref:amidohydrolase family protein n=1 Tax=Gracilimonas sp. TaxID=1974203 RepID=UPI003751E3DA|nr:amidohydrolase family protein [Gracilimonas sp.]
MNKIKAITTILSIMLLMGISFEGIAQKKFGGLAEGPYDRLVIRNAMVIPGHGGPPVGPYDIVIEGDKITEMIPFDPVTAERRGDSERPTGNRVIEADGKYVMPGMIDLHMHLRQDPMEIEYVYYTKLAHGVTTMVPAPDRGLDNAMAEASRSENNEILAPRMYPIWGWGSNTDFDREFLENPDNAPEVAAEMFEKGAHVVSVGSLGWNQKLLGAVTKAVTENGGITTYHIPPNTTSVTQAVDAARLGVTMIEHHYAYAESSLDRQVQDYPRDYNYNDENARFRHAGKVWTEANRERLLGEVADSLFAYGVHMLPTRVVYEANRDILRAASLPWNEKYTHQALINWNLPNPAFHGSYHYDWTSDDEYYWSYAFDLWGDLIYEFNKRGGHVSYGTDDNYIWATPGFSNIRELQLLRETGMHTLEVLKAATRNSAITLREEKLGLVRPGYTADLIIVDGSPLYNLRNMYSFGAINTDQNGDMFRSEGIVHTIKGGVVIENDLLMEEVARMVKASKEGVSSENIMTAPFLVD